MVDEKDESKIEEIVRTWIQAKIFLEKELRESQFEMSENEIICCLNRVVEDVRKWKISDKISSEKNESMDRFKSEKNPERKQEANDWKEPEKEPGNKKSKWIPSKNPDVEYMIMPDNHLEFRNIKTGDKWSNEQRASE